MALELDRFRNARQAEEAAAREAEALGLRAAAAEHAARRARGAGDAVAAAASEQVAQDLRAQRAQALRLRLEQAAEIGQLLGGMDRRAETLIGTLSTRHPVALLPVRIETRFDRDAAGAVAALRVRIFPDQIHLHQHRAVLTPAEVAAGRAYWTALHADPAAAATAWAALVDAVARPERAAFVMDRLRPRNTPPAEPEFRDVEGIDAAGPVPAQARLLPTRWLVLLCDADWTVFHRAWGETIPDSLAAAPFGEALQEAEDASADDAAEADDQAPPPVPDAATQRDAEDFAWVTDFARAQAVGMALTIPQADLAGRALANGVPRLVVLGVDWTMTPEEAAQRLAAQLEAHGYADGLEFLAPGTPTNARSGGAEHRAEQAQRFHPAPWVAPAATPLPAEAEAARLALALGLDPGLAPSLARFPGGAADRETVPREANTALWGAVFGFWFAELLDGMVPEPMLDALRSHVRDFLRPAGPLPALRIGRQPYGLLPVLGLPIRRTQEAAFAAWPAFEAGLARMLGRMRGWAEAPSLPGAAASRPLDALPGMANIPRGEDTPDVLAAILKRGPVAARGAVRLTIGEWSRLHSTAAKDEAARLHALRVGAIFADLGLSQERLMVSEHTTLPRILPERMPVPMRGLPWVAAELAGSDAPRRAYEKLAARLEGLSRSRDDDQEDRNRVMLAQSADHFDTLYEALLFVSAAHEVERLVLKLVLDLPRQAGIATTQRFAAEMAGIEATPAGSALLQVETPWQALGLQRAGAATSLAQEVHAGLEAVRHLPPQAVEPETGFRDLHAQRRAAEILADRPAAELDHALRGLLDCGSHRLDAWITSVATRRLEALRGATRQGLHLGGWGIVHDLRPDPLGEASEGFVQVPTLRHGAAAAVIRAAHMANRDDSPDAFAVRLDSARVRDALAISEGVGQGQPAGALLGYRLEKRLLEDKPRAKFIGPLRRLCPLPGAAAVVAPVPEAVEAMPPAGVVDGLALAMLWQERDNDAAFFAKLRPHAGFDLAEPDLAALRTHLQALLELADAFGDLWSFEAVHHLASGNLDRAAAAMAVTDRQAQPPEAQGVRTPREAWGYTQKLLWLRSADAVAEGWPADVAAEAEPVGNAIAASLLGPPDRFALAGEVVAEDGTTTPLAGLALTDLGLSPLGLLRLAEAEAEGGLSRLEARAGAVLERRAAPLPAGGRVRMRPDPPEGAEAFGLAALLALLIAAREALFDRPAANCRDIVPPRGPVADGVERAALRARVQALENAVTNAVAALDAAADRAARLEALRTASALAEVPALVHADPTPERMAEEAVALAVEAARASLEALRQRCATRLADATQAEAEGTESPGEAVAADAEAIRRVFGAGFPILPPFSLPPEEAAACEASLGQRAELLGPGGAFEIVRWQRAMAMVRPRMRALLGALDAASLTGHEAGATANLVQLPLQPGQRWVALPFADPERPPRATLLAAVLLGDTGSADVALDAPFAGFAIDSWVEAIPERRVTTSVTFHHDAPGARPPQSILLALDPGLGAQGWSTDALLAAVREAFDLARLRLLAPEDIAGHGAVLPTTLVPRNVAGQSVSVDLATKFDKVNLTLSAFVAGRE
ncbi:hypothetical protein ACLF3G_21600 [Falsiroseomonas sp. HC035]|uniref:hypothetical protein n=1 Tax=Falsiroseomonas sp. HC035 TaxID=3390999 RepID=UPI003D31804E